MNHTKEKGITIMALVVSIIVMLILAGVSVMAVFGDNGLIEQAKESILLTKLADILFDVESDIVAVKMNDYGTKYTTTQVLILLYNLNDKYTLRTVNSTIGGVSASAICSAYLRLTESPIEDLIISLTGDVYVDNYKRGKVQISDIYEEITSEGRLYGDSTIKVNDGSVSENTKGFFEISYVDYDGTNMNLNCLPWINSNNEVIAWGSTFQFYSLGITNYDFATLDLSYYDAYSQYNNKYALFSSANYSIIDDKITFEFTLYNFYKNTKLYSPPIASVIDQNGNYIYAVSELTFGGTYPYYVGVKIFTDSDDQNSNDIIYYISASNYYAYASYSSINSSMHTYIFNIDKSTLISDFQETYDITPKRLYYITYVGYLKYTGESTSGTPLYQNSVSPFYGTVIKYIDLD